MKIREIHCKNCMTKSKLTDYVINPYIGCQHGCKYCYAVFMKRFQNIKENWGDFIYVKKNCVELLKKELEKNKPGHIWMSSVTDCYSPIEAKYKLTRKILQTILDSKYGNKFTIEILTKSALVNRDLDLIKKLNAELGMTLNTMDEKISRIIEPFASSPKKRIETLKEAKKQKIPVFGFISPVLPGITDLEELFKNLSFCHYVWVELLNIKKSVLDRLIPVIKRQLPDKLEEFEYVINNYEKYCREFKKQAKELGTKYNLKIKGVIVH